MATGRINQLTQMAGEFIVSSQLCRRGFLCAPFAGNVPEFDLVAVNENKSILIQVKTITETSNSWQFNASKYLDIVFDGDSQTIKGKTILLYPDLIFVFVKLKEHGYDEYFILKHKELQEIIFKDYETYLHKKGGVRPKKATSTHTAVFMDSLVKYRDNWQIIS